MQTLALIIALAAWNTAASAYTWAVVRSVMPGVQRVISLLPVTLVYFLLPPLVINREEAPITIQILTCILSASAFKVSTDQTLLWNMILACDVSTGCIIWCSISIPGAANLSARIPCAANSGTALIDTLNKMCAQLSI